MAVPGTENTLSGKSSENIFAVTRHQIKLPLTTWTDDECVAGEQCIRTASAAHDAKALAVGPIEYNRVVASRGYIHSVL